jgi:DNA-directed RNA polymerase specialized sigma subunit
MTVVTPPPTLPDASPAVLWREYRATGDGRLRDRLVFMLAPLVRYAGAADDTRAEAGLRAVLAAVETYAPERDGALEPYAWSRVRAALASSR